eukprot:TRINITY_DN6064_c0_g2_i3.p2 TRINITY_DN6064_c0_g2~~TRINITY_DN6064_c0_g2_i3.p2  ORF type:complete len:238 (+),score=18.79 TRINITY_DN6064_c0_g2_i3:258-971(+)
MMELQSYPTFNHYQQLFEHAETEKKVVQRSKSANLTRVLSDKWLNDIADLEDQYDYERLCRLHNQSSAVSTSFYKKINSSMLSIDEDRSMDDVIFNGMQQAASSSSGSSSYASSTYSSCYDDEPSLRRDSALTQRVDWDTFLARQSNNEWVIIEGYENCGFSKHDDNFMDKSLLNLHQQVMQEERELEQRLSMLVGDCLRGMSSVSRCNNSRERSRISYWEAKNLFNFADSNDEDRM